MFTLKNTLLAIFLFSFTSLYAQPVEYAVTSPYNKGQLVIVDSSDTYIALQPVPVGKSPPDSTYWVALADEAKLQVISSDELAKLPSTDVADILKTKPNSAPDANSSSGGGATSSSKIINISTAGYSLTGAQKMSAGFIISGSEDMKVYIKAEKSQEAGITPLTNPKLEIWNVSRTSKLYENDNWGTNSNVSEIQALGGSYPPIEATDAAVLVTLSPGAYLADVFGAAGNTGKALVAVNDVDSSSSSKLINISTAGYSYQGAQKMSAGFIVTGTEDVKVYIKAEKSQEAGITPLSNPKLEIWNVARTSKLYENDNWGTNSNVSEIQALGGSYPPIEATDAAVLVTLPPGAYLVDVFGASGNSGKGLVAVNLVN